MFLATLVESLIRENGGIEPVGFLKIQRLKLGEPILYPGLHRGLVHFHRLTAPGSPLCALRNGGCGVVGVQRPGLAMGRNKEKRSIRKKTPGVRKG